MIIRINKYMHREMKIYEDTRVMSVDEFTICDFHKYNIPGKNKYVINTHSNMY